MEKSPELKTYEDIEREAKERHIYTSRTKLGLCKNDGCNRERREYSAYCQFCSVKHNHEV